jgi:hypothetical protein
VVGALGGPGASKKAACLITELVAPKA